MPACSLARKRARSLAHAAARRVASVELVSNLIPAWHVRVALRCFPGWRDVCRGQPDSDEGNRSYDACCCCGSSIFSTYSFKCFMERA